MLRVFLFFLLMALRMFVCYLCSFCGCNKNIVYKNTNLDCDPNLIPSVLFYTLV